MISLAGSGAAGYLSATGRGDAQYHPKEYPENIVLKQGGRHISYWKYFEPHFDCGKVERERRKVSQLEEQAMAIKVEQKYFWLLPLLELVESQVVLIQFEPS